MQSSSALKARKDLLQIFSRALAEVEGGRVASRWLSNSNLRELAVIATGKAASAMMGGAEQSLGQHLVEGLLVTKSGHVSATGHGPNVEIYQAAHPVPDASSLEAGQGMLDFIARQPLDRPLLFLVSGGTSSLVEVLVEDVQLADLILANEQLLGSGLAIDQINRRRRQFSRLKGGGLGQYLENRSAQVLLISDVPDDDPGVIGSGMLLPSENIKLQVIASLDDAMRAAALAAEQLGYVVSTETQRLAGDAAALGRDFARALLRAEPGIYIRGGETTVALPEQAGTGGRNQHLALAAAIEIADHENILVLAVGTDGTDGPTVDAGALVDGQTVYRGELGGFDVMDTLKCADAGTFLAASGDLVQTGPTGTNVMDLLIGIKWTDG